MRTKAISMGKYRLDYMLIEHCLRNSKKNDASHLGKTALLTALLFFAFLFQTNAQTPAYKGMYVDNFDNIIGNAAEEDSLLHYLKDSSFNAIICYNISSVISSTASNPKNATLASFMKRARTQYGIKNILASSENYDTFLTLVSPYNRSRTDTSERFTYYYLEFEFWNLHKVSPRSTTNDGYYCDNYLYPRGYTCDTAGAFRYYRKMLKSVDSLANVDHIKSATYIDAPNIGQCQFIAKTTDFVLCEVYTSKPEYSYINGIVQYWEHQCKWPILCDRHSPMNPNSSTFFCNI